MKCLPTTASYLVSLLLSVNIVRITEKSALPQNAFIKLPIETQSIRKKVIGGYLS